MKKILITICACIGIMSVAHADSINLNWYVDGNVYDTSTCTIGGDLILPTTPTKRGHTFMGWSRKYIPIEYIESTGTQWIDTGYYPTNNTGIKTKAELLNLANGAAVVFGGADNYNSQGMEFYVWDGAIMFLYGNARATGLKVGSIGSIVELDWNKKFVTYSINASDSQIVFNAATFTSPKPIWIAHINRSVVRDEWGVMRYYYFKIYDNDVLVRDFIPVLDKNGVACMYDKVSHQFFYNAGTGDFIAGPIITE